jgi:16S rRNA (cytosine1402-N4)-methyltransferase
MGENKNYHIPVLLHDCIDGLKINPNGIYVDVTFGGGGHSGAILEKLTSGKLFAFDQDEDAHANAINDSRFVLVKSNFRNLRTELANHRVEKIDGLLADLGVSSHQFDAAERGFSFRYNAKLDMRMNRSQKNTAVDIVNQYEQNDLRQIFFNYGELKNAGRIAMQIIKARRGNKIEMIDDLKQVLSNCINKKNESKFLSQVFQALRIELNDELAALREMLLQAEAMLNVGGRLVVMSYHSLEDRVVKNFMKTGNLKGELQKDFYGNILTPFKQITRKPIEPDDSEIKINARSRSAKLRIAEKI